MINGEKKWIGMNPIWHYMKNAPHPVNRTTNCWVTAGSLWPYWTLIAGCSLPLDTNHLIHNVL